MFYWLYQALPGKREVFTLYHHIYSVYRIPNILNTSLVLRYGHLPRSKDRKPDSGARIGLICLRVGTSGELLWTRQWTLWFHNIRRISWLAEHCVTQRCAVGAETIDYRAIDRTSRLRALSGAHTSNVEEEGDIKNILYIYKWLEAEGVWYYSIKN
jgi:hypothetical protein